MSLTIPISSTPNQELSVELEGSLYIIVLQSITGTMTVTLTRDDALLLSGIRIIPNAPLIPFQYLSKSNFVFISNDDQLPNFELIDISQFLVYMTEAEMDAANEL